MLALVVLLLTVPWMSFRVLRPSGDDKIYIAQAVEMWRDGHWFAQTLANEPNFLKGPFHYLWVRMGLEIWGWSPWASLWMNGVLAVVGAYALQGLWLRYRPTDREGAFFAAAASSVANVGVWPFLFASQMEAELAALVTCTWVALVATRPEQPARLFWILCGALAWVKSPLHSALLGVSALGFWFTVGEWRVRFKRPADGLALLVGVGVAVLGYVPVYASNPTAFVQQFLLRENVDKAPNGGAWYAALLALTTHFLMPWVFLWVPALLRGLQAISLAGRRLGWAAFWALLPGGVFFAVFPYRMQVYNLPWVPLLLFTLIWWVWAECSPIEQGVLTRTRQRAVELTLRWAIHLRWVFWILPAAGVAFLQARLDPWPSEWWPRWLAALPLAGVFLATVIDPPFEKKLRPRRWVWGAVLFFSGFAVTAVVLGERELHGIQSRVQPKDSLYYYNVHRAPWSEWAALGLALRHPVTGIHDGAALARLFDLTPKNFWLVVPGETALEQLKEAVTTRYPSLKLEVIPWKRWKTQGGGALSTIWNTGHWQDLERDFYLVRWPSLN